jgi:uncharacterized iron-regulated protein
MKYFVLTFLLFSFCFERSFAQEKQAFKLFRKEGKSVEYQKMITELAKADVVLFGEMHDNSINHWLELQVAKDLYAINPKLTLGFEMFEADNQLVLNEYLTGVIEERHLLSEAKVWDNYKNDYKPLIEFCKAQKLNAIATNVPRRYANLVYRKGIETLATLPEEARQHIAPLPIEIDLELPGYKNMISSMGGHGGPGSGENMARSQAVKDATMAHFIIQNLKEGIFIHYHGAYHSQNFDGIYHYLKKAKPSLKVVTIHPVSQEAVDKLNDENKNTADFIIAIPTDMTKTY